MAVGWFFETDLCRCHLLVSGFDSLVIIIRGDCTSIVGLDLDLYGCDAPTVSVFEKL